MSLSDRNSCLNRTRAIGSTRRIVLSATSLATLLVICLVDDAHATGTKAPHQCKAHGIEHRAKTFGLGMQMMRFVECERELVRGGGLVGRRSRLLERAFEPVARGRDGLVTGPRRPLELGILVNILVFDRLGQAFGNAVGRSQGGGVKRLAGGAAALTALAVNECANQTRSRRRYQERRSNKLEAAALLAPPPLALIDQKDVEPIDR